MIVGAFIMVWVASNGADLPTLTIMATVGDKQTCEQFAAAFNSTRGEYTGKGYFACIPPAPER